ncbi:MAG: DUF4870 domain-containing protein, partial [Candidatus Omnitrophota bacterium]
LNGKERIMPDKELGKTSIGMKANVAAALSYLLGFVSGIIIYLLEKENKFVRFHAMQSIVTFGLLWLVSVLVWVLPFVGTMLAPLIYMLEVALWITLIIAAYQGKYLKLPIAADVAEKMA